jgi:hypothetical protein
LKQGGLVAAAAAAAVLVAAKPRPVGAQTRTEAATVEDLQRALSERDAAISDLMRRVEELERRLGTTPVGQAPPAAVEPGAAEPGATPPAAPEEEPLPQAAEELEEVAPPAETVRPAPGEFEVDEEGIDRALERALVQTGALLLPAGTIEVEPSFTYLRREADAPQLIVENDQVVAAANEFRQNEFDVDLTLRLGLPFDSQLEVGVPYSYEEISNVETVGFAARREDNLNGAGLGDVRVGLAKTLLRERGWRPDLLGRVQWDSKTGETEDGVSLGSGFHEVTGSLTAVKRQDPLVFVGTASYTTSLEDDGVDAGDDVGFSLGTVLAASPETSLRFFLSQTFTDELEVDGREIEGTDQVSTSLFIGVSSIVAPRVLFDVAAGIGLTEDAPDYSITASLPIRFDLPFRF